MYLGIKELFLAIKELCFPPRCLGCDANLPTSADPMFCLACADNIEFIKEPLCSLCGKAFPKAAGGNHRCSRCLKKAPLYNRARAIAHYKGPLVKAIHDFKYGGRTAALSSFANLRNSLPHLGIFGEVDIILPVPLHIKRLRERGFNQAQQLAQTFFPEEKEKILVNLLLRHKWTAPQTGLSGSARRKNLKNAFQVTNADEVKKKNVLLVDDVYTTGATVNECAKVLRRAGAREVQVFTLARVED